MFSSLLAFILGLAVGSFLNVVIIRGARGESLGGRSRCESCKKELSWSELIPLFSFVFQKGRCRSCGGALSLQYPLVELSTGVLFAGAVAWAGQIGPLGLTGLIAALSASIVIFVSDLRWQIIPNGAVLVLSLVGILRLLARVGVGLAPDLNLVVWAVGGAVVFSLFFAALWFFSKGRWMGFGDAKLVFATSLLLGWPASMAAFLFSFWLGGAVGGALLAGGKKLPGSQIPFGPLILIGSALAYFWGEKFFGFLLLR